MFDGKELSAYSNPEDLSGIDEAELRALKVGYRAKMIKRVSEAEVPRMPCAKHQPGILHQCGYDYVRNMKSELMQTSWARGVEP